MQIILRVAHCIGAALFKVTDERTCSCGRIETRAAIGILGLLLGEKLGLILLVLDSLYNDINDACTWPEQRER
jgi:hypothetical protein